MLQGGMWKEVVEAMWTACFEFRKGCDLYRALIGCLTDLLFHRDALACPDCHACIIKVRFMVRQHSSHPAGLFPVHSCGVIIEINSFALRSEF